MIKTYLAGPIDRVNIAEAQEWRNWITEQLKPFHIETLNPFDKQGGDGGDRLAKKRKDLHNWNLDGEIDKIRNLVGIEVIPPDLVMVEQCDFLTLYIPSLNGGSEICGSYGETTYAFKLKKPILIITDRKLKPNEVPNWIIGCSTKIFTNWDSYLNYVSSKTFKC